MTDAATTPGGESLDRAGRAGLWIGLVLGIPIIGWGIRGILTESARTHPGELGRWIVGSALVHDALVLPVVFAVAMLARLVVPPRAWPLVRWGMTTTAILLVVSWPFVRGYGRRSSNPSLLPRDYGTGVIVAVAGVWLVVVALALRGRRRARRSGPPVSR